MQTSWLVPLLLATCLRAGDSAGDWPVYGGDAGGKRFSALRQITRENVTALQVAWVYHTGDAYQPQHGRSTAFEATPLYLDGTLYLSTPLGRAVALDPLTGKEKWSYRAKLDRDAGFGDFASRGVATWKPREGGRRIYLATIDARLIALDASTGKPCEDFGGNGEINLRQGLRIAPRSFEDYEETSPPVVIGDTVIIGSGVADNGSVSQASGEVRAFDARTGLLKWTWDPIPQKASDTGGGHVGEGQYRHNRRSECVVGDCCGSREGAGFHPDR
jgi:quinoprotein glucose dehydrogenase